MRVVCGCKFVEVEWDYCFCIWWCIGGDDVVGVGVGIGEDDILFVGCCGYVVGVVGFGDYFGCWCCVFGEYLSEIDVD